MSKKKNTTVSRYRGSFRDLSEISGGKGVGNRGKVTTF